MSEQTPISTANEPLVSVAELSRLRPCFTETWLRQTRARDAGPAHYKLGGRVFYRLSEVDAWIESNRVEPQR